MNVVISQPMFFPWVGMFEQIRLADICIHYSDVQFSKGSFVNRVQIKTANGVKWLTVPLRGFSLGQNINQVCIDQRHNWRARHFELLRQAYAETRYRDDMLALVESIYRNEYETIDKLSEATLMGVCRYFGLDNNRCFMHSEKLNIPGASSRRVLDLVLAVGGDRYITGLGARRYLDHRLFEQHGVSVEYMNYRKIAYPQRHGDFTPYVSILDLIANLGPAGDVYLCSGTTFWKDEIGHG